MSIHFQVWDTTFQVSFWLFTAPFWYMCWKLYQRRTKQYEAAVEYNGEVLEENERLVQMLAQAHRIYEHCEAYDSALCRSIFTTSDYLLFCDDMENLLKRKKFNNQT